MLPVNALLGMVGLVSAVVPLTHFAEEPWLLSPAGPAGALEAVFAAGAAKGSALDTHTLTLCHEPEWLWGRPGLLRKAAASLDQLLQDSERPCLGSLCGKVVIGAPGKIITTPNLLEVLVGMHELQPSYQRRLGIQEDARLLRQSRMIIEENANHAVSDVAQAPQHANVLLQDSITLENLKVAVGTRIRDVV